MSNKTQSILRWSGYLFLLFFDGGSVFFESSVSAFEVDGAKKKIRPRNTSIELKKVFKMA